jgi:hypothetical protein
VLGVAEAMITQYTGMLPGLPRQFGGSSWKDVWAFALLIFVLVFRPQGLLGAGWWTAHELRLPNHPRRQPAPQHASKGWPLALAGSVLLLVRPALVVLRPEHPRRHLDRLLAGDLQLFAIFLGVIGMFFALMHQGAAERLGNWFDAALGLRALGDGQRLFILSRRSWRSPMRPAV